MSCRPISALAAGGLTSWCDSATGRTSQDLCDVRQNSYFCRKDMRVTLAMLFYFGLVFELVSFWVQSECCG